MTTARELEYHAQYQKRLRAEARKRGKKQLNGMLDERFFALLDATKTECGLTSRMDALEHVLDAYFAGGNSKRNHAVSA